MRAAALRIASLACLALFLSQCFTLGVSQRYPADVEKHPERWGVAAAIEASTYFLAGVIGVVAQEASKAPATSAAPGQSAAPDRLPESRSPASSEAAYSPRWP